MYVEDFSKILAFSEYLFWRFYVLVRISLLERPLKNILLRMSSDIPFNPVWHDIGKQEKCSSSKGKLL